MQKKERKKAPTKIEPNRPEYRREFQERQKARRMEIVSKLLVEEEQKERLKKQHPPAPVTQRKVLKRREQKLLKDLLPLSAPVEREV